MSNTLLIIGATSAIAQATAREFAAEGTRFMLVARDADRLQLVADDLRARGATEVACLVMDALDYNAHRGLLEKARAELGEVGRVLIAHGVLPDQKVCEESFTAARESLEINFISVVSLLSEFADYMETRRQGVLAVVSSVAGDRGRQSNYIYGAAKGGLNIFLEGLRNRLYPAGVQVLTIEPGFVDTPMTASITARNFLWASPEVIGRGIRQAIHKKKDIVYLPWFWWPIMFIVRHVPEVIFKRLKL